MEEQILDIINKSYARLIREYSVDRCDNPNENCTKALTAHFLEFIEWITKNIQYNDVHDYYRFNNRIKGIISIFDTKEELYQYWINNIK